MRPVSDCAFYTHLKAYLDEMHVFMPKRISSATCSAVAILQCDAHPDNAEDYFEEDEDFIDGLLRGIYEWANNHEGLLEYLKDRYENWGDDDDESWLFYIGDTNRCHYKSYEEFAADLDLEMIITIFNNCWERSSQFKFPRGRQLLKDYPEFKVDYSKNKKLKGDELLSQIKKDIIPIYEKIKSYGYISVNKNGDEVSDVDEFFQEHTKALENKKNNGHEIPDYKFPLVMKKGNLPKGNYLFGDLGIALRIGNKKLFREFKSFANQIDIPDDEFYLCPPFFVDFLKKEKGIYPDGVCKLDDESTFLTITLGVDESYFSDDNGGRLFQGSGTLICLKVSDDFIYKNEELTFYQFSSDFDCHYYKDYGIIKLGEFHVYESE